jgi:hypothetical protein
MLTLQEYKNHKEEQKTMKQEQDKIISLKQNYLDEEKKIIRFTNLSLPLKILTVFAWIYFGLVTIFFFIGFFETLMTL